MKIFLLILLNLSSLLCLSQNTYLFKVFKDNNIVFFERVNNQSFYSNNDVTIEYEGEGLDKVVNLKFTSEQYPPINLYGYQYNSSYPRKLTKSLNRTLPVSFKNFNSTLSNGNYGEVNNSFFGSFNELYTKINLRDFDFSYNYQYEIIHYLFFVFSESSSSLSNYKSFDKQLNLYPNPTNDILNIDIEDYKSSELFNIIGQSILKTDEKSLDLSKFNKGVYFLTIEKNNGIKTKGIKVLKE